MVAIVPVTVMVPAVLMFVPPLMALSPAPLAGFAQLIAPVIGLPAMRSMMLDGFMEFVVGMRDAPEAIVVVAGGVGRARKQKRDPQRGCGQRLSCDKSYSRVA